MLDSGCQEVRLGPQKAAGRRPNPQARTPAPHFQDALSDAKVQSSTDELYSNAIKAEHLLVGSFFKIQHAFAGEEQAFPMEAAGKAADAMRGQDAVARNENGYRVCATGGADSAEGSRPADGLGDLPVSQGAWDATQGLPDKLLKFGAGRKIERRKIATGLTG